MHTAPTRVLIVDDEPLARERLRSLLSEDSGFEVAGEAGDGAAAAQAIATLNPDLVFLDVQMPGGDGFDVIDAVGADKMPFVVFVTAYDRYALRAFDVHALDYLLKPFDRERFRQALTRANQQLDKQKEGDIERRLAAIVNDLRPTKARADRFVVKSGGRIFFVRTSEIDWIEAAGNYVKLHVGNDSHLIRETMNNVEGKLSPETFVRIHRCHIVNIEQVRELQPWFNGEYVVFLKNGTRLTLSRGYRERLQDRIGRPI
ncbi:MAG TPA: LytTR family DNA-binding domain-containing protein [Vicinamibacterales bacterium]|jgi:two-component system LytT family response regulator